MTEQNQKRNWLVILLFIALGGALYANSLNVPFYFDDFGNVKRPALQMEKGSLEEISRVFSEGRLTTRPVSNLSFAMNYYFGGYRVPGYHVVNIAIHISTAIAFYFLICCTLALPVNRKQYDTYSGIAFFAALLWLAHPVATQSVTYLVQRMTSMATMFYILSVLCYALGRSRQQTNKHRFKLLPLAFFFLSFCMGILAAGSKEIAITLPIAIFLYEIYFFQNPSWKWLIKKTPIILALFLFVASVCYIYLGPALLTLFSTECPTRDFNVLERVLTQPRVVVHYMGLLLYPAADRLFLDYNFPLSVSILSPLSTLLSILFIASLCTLAVVYTLKERLLSFCIIWFFLTLILESSFICLELVFEHRTYLPATFFYLFFVVLMSRIVKNKKVLSIALALVVICFSTWTIQRNAIWLDPVKFWGSIVQEFPKDARANNNYGKALGATGNEIEAEKYFQEALKLDPRATHPYQNIGILYDKKGNTKVAELYYRKAIKRDKGNTIALLGLSDLLLREARYIEAVEVLKHAGKLKTGQKYFIPKLGKAMLRAGMTSDAVEMLSKAKGNDPENVGILIDLATAYMQEGNTDLAQHNFEKVIAITPGSLVAHYNLALLTLQKGLGNKALEHYRQATLLLTEKPPVHYNYANLLLRAGNHKEAEKNYLQVLSKVRIIADSYNNLGIIYANRADTKKAKEYFQAAINVDPQFKNARDNLLLLQE